jgi:heme oxygenase
MKELSIPLGGQLTLMLVADEESGGQYGTEWLNRRSQRKSFNWDEFQELLQHFPLPRPRIVKSYRWIYAADL